MVTHVAKLSTPPPILRVIPLCAQVLMRYGACIGTVSITTAIARLYEHALHRHASATHFAIQAFALVAGLLVRDFLGARDSACRFARAVSPHRAGRTYLGLPAGRKRQLWGCLGSDYMPVHDEAQKSRAAPWNLRG